MRRSFHVVVMLLALVARSAGQSSTSTTLQGTVLAPDGSVIPRAHVELFHVPTGSIYRTPAGDDGQFRFTGLRVGGPYELRVSHIGFSSERRTGLFLRLLENARVTVRLRQVAIPGEEVVVTGSRHPPAITQSEGASLQVSRDQLAALPLPSGSFEDALRVSPYMVGSSALGVNAIYNDVALDGIGIADPFGLQHAENAPAGMQVSPVDIESLEEIRVDFSPFDVRRSGFTGASIAAVSRSGSNTLKGSVHIDGAGGWLVGKNPDDGRKDYRGYVDGKTGFHLGGPIIRSKAFFFLSGELSSMRLPLERRFGAPSTSGSVFSFPEGAITQMITTLNTRRGYDPGRLDIVSLERETARLFGRLDVSLRPRHQLSVRFNSLVTLGESPPRGTTVYAEGTLARTRSHVHTVMAELNSVFGPRVSNELLASFTSRRFTSSPKGEAFPFVDVVVTDRAGWWNHVTVGSEIGGNGQRLSQDHLEIRNATGFNSAEHLVTVGIQGELNWFRSSLLSAGWGSYTFASMNDLNNGRPNAYEYRYPVNGGTLNGAPWRAVQIGGFVQDEWRPSPLVSVSAGVRVDVPVLPDKPKENPLLREAFLPLGYTLSTSTLPQTRAMISPRFGISAYPKEDRTIQLRGGIGLFTGRIPYAWIGNLYDGTGMDYVHIKTSDHPPAFVADPAHQPTPASDTTLHATTEIVVAANDFVLPQELRWTFAYDQELPWNLRLSFEGVYSRTINGVVIKNLNLNQNGTLDPEKSGDARPVYGSAYPVGMWSYSRNDARFTDVMYMTNGAEGTSTFLTMQLQRKPGPEGLFASLAYTYASTMDLNSGTWDNAYDQWRYNPTEEPNKPRLNYSSFDRTHRIAAAVSIRHVWGKGYATTAGLVYTGASGIPYSYVYDGDLNGDGESFNDLFYVPGTSAEILLVNEDGFLTVPSDPAYNQLMSFIAHDPYLSTHRRQIAERNGARTPWTHLLDLRLAQTLPTAFGNEMEFSAELLNVMNLIDPSWGLVQTVPYQVVPILRFFTRDSRGRPWFRWSPRTTPLVAEPLLSRWRLRLGVRVTF
jgi:hypothetical protein